jgi:hypothetical protein
MSLRLQRYLRRLGAHKCRPGRLATDEATDGLANVTHWFCVSLKSIQTNKISSRRSFYFLGGTTRTVMDSFDLQFDHAAAEDTNPREEKGKKKRTMFSPEQKALLESTFAANPYPDKLMRKKLADELNVKDKSIDYWFGHRRAKCAKQKKGAAADVDSSATPSTVESPAPSPVPKKEKLVKSPVSVMEAVGSLSFHSLLHSFLHVHRRPRDGYVQRCAIDGSPSGRWWSRCRPPCARALVWSFRLRRLP